MKRIVLIILCGVFLLPMMGCTSNALPSWVHEEQLIQHAKSTLDLVNARDFDALADELVGVSVTGSQLEEGLGSTLDSFGAFQSYGSSRIDVFTENGVEYVQVQQVVNYQNKSVTYRVVFNKEGNLAGLWL